MLGGSALLGPTGSDYGRVSGGEGFERLAALERAGAGDDGRFPLHDGCHGGAMHCCVCAIVSGRLHFCV